MEVLYTPTFEVREFSCSSYIISLIDILLIVHPIVYFLYIVDNWRIQKSLTGKLEEANLNLIRLAAVL